MGGDGVGAVYSFILFAVIASVFALGGRSETVRMIRGDGRDERWAIIDMAATAITGLVLIIAIIAGCLYEWSQGRDGSCYRGRPHVRRPVRAPCGSHRRRWSGAAMPRVGRSLVGIRVA
jgi:hypothetical protein